MTLRQKWKRKAKQPTLDKVSVRAKVNPEIPPLKYGREMEPHAIASFTTMFETYHRKATVQSCPIFLCNDLPFLGGSPDSIVTCDCCGKFCLEVKCPFTIKGCVPLNPEVKLNYIRKENSQSMMLKKSHRYYSKCQV